MDEAIGDEVAEPVDGTHILKKDNEFLFKSGIPDMLQSNEMVTPGAADYPDKSRNRFSDVLDAKDLDRIGSSEHASASPHCMDDAGIMVEELTLRNYDGDKSSIMGASNNIERMQTRRNQWQNLYQIAGGSGANNLHGQTGYKGKGQANSSAWEDRDNNFFSGLVEENPPTQNHIHNAPSENLLSNDDKGSSGDILYPSGGIRTKVLSKSGFSEYFVKSTLKDKGVLHKRQAGRGSGSESGNQDHHPKSGFGGSRNSVASLGLTLKPVSEPCVAFSSRSISDGISLREWLEAGGKKANKVQKMHIFKQVLDLVDFSHSHGVCLQDLRPSGFKLSGSYQVMYLGSRASVTENVKDQNVRISNHKRIEKRPIQQSMLPLENHSLKKQKLGENMKFMQRWPQFPSRSGIRSAFPNVSNLDTAESLDPSNDLDERHNPKPEIKNHGRLPGHSVHSSSQTLQGSVSVMLEEKWYSSPELFNEKGCTSASNIYSLGVLLFELLGSFDSGRSHAAAMLDLRHRILPPSFLSENPKEAGFCLWLLHPEPSSRPTTRDILQSEFISGIQELPGGEVNLSNDEEDGESELLSYFLLSLNEQKQKDASDLMKQIQCIEADIQEIEKRQPKKSLLLSSSAQGSLTARGSSYTHGGNASADSFLKMSPLSDRETRLNSNIKQFENAYFSMRSNIQLSEKKLATHRDGELLKSRENWGTMEKEDKYSTADRLGGFFDGLCKYARYSKFKVQGIMRSGEFNNSANVICSLSFDRDEDYLAAGGVSKKIKIFEFQSLFNDSVDIHYPVVEMANESKISCICWNSYIRNYLASTDYDGIVKLWDASTGQGFSQFIEHSQRAWSVDFSRVDPTKLASGSDDRLVKIWSINDKKSLCTIKNNANICSVQFSAHSAHLLACTSADYKTYCYDLRNVSTPWCILAGHDKAVSYAKFLDAGTLVSASTDNTVKIWDLSKTDSNCLSRDACVLTLRGHTNEKNFVGLSVSDGYITCGSETNEVYAYHKSLPMPITAHKFGSIDPVTGKDTEDDNGQFVSSVCFRRKSNMVVAANSSGCIKLLQLV
ncbi:hypothetical protein ACP275_05G111900 [Erythranthe tilingii]